ncbi:MAG TPA: response regulator [Candidatus Hydrogenedentes bacterium]|nr:response regulator [Candidatus Hydrogenedentota bacterium]HOJ68182.1 response regulator [Candidatus Hydrogenedentota bacterium]HOK89156.1 response regulator [Candidatus Hydrogenedentota bacterium]
MAKVIYADWDETLGNQVKALLNANGLECDWVKSGREALNLMEQDSAQLVVAEIMMPDVSGFELCRRIRALDRGWETPVLLVSSMSAEEEVRHALAQGADDFLSKPIHPPMLVTKVNHLLNADPPVAQPDPVTGLFNHRHMKYLLQRRLVKKEPFALVCAELLNMPRFKKAAGEEGRNKAMRHLARILEACGKKVQSGFAAAHMGGGHFVCLMPPQYAQAFGKSAYRLWTEHIPELCDALGIRMNSGEALPEAAVYFMFTGNRQGTTAQECFTRLAQIRGMAIAAGPGVFLDRRGLKLEGIQEED